MRRCLTGQEALRTMIVDASFEDRERLDAICAGKEEEGLCLVQPPATARHQCIAVALERLKAAGQVDERVRAAAAVSSAAP